MEFIQEESSDVVHNSKSSTRCSKDKRNIIFETLLKHNVNGKVKYGSVKDVASMYLVSTRTVSRIWKKGIACVTDGVPVDISLNLSALNAVAVSEGMFVPTRPLCVSINIDGVCSDRLNSTQSVLANLMKSSVAQVEKMLLDDKELLHSLEAEEQAPASTR
nr:uncharacterized protein LOC111908693 [Ipomoea trifida]